MAENRFRVKENDKPRGRGFFGFLSAKLNIGQTLNSELPVKHLPKVVFTVLIGVFYVWNSHFAEKSIREIDKLEDVVEDLKADVTTLEANYMYGSKQSEVAKKVKPLGLIESMEPPEKIIVEDNEY